MYKFETFDKRGESILKQAFKNKHIYNFNSDGYSEYKDRYTMRYKTSWGDYYDYDGDYDYDKEDIDVTKYSMDYKKYYDAYHDGWTDMPSKEKYKATKNGYVSNVKGKEISTTITATRVD